MLPPGESMAFQCSGCGRTVLTGDPGPDSPDGEKIIKQDFGCPSCGRKWTQSFLPVFNTLHKIRCPNPDCPKPAEIEWKLEE
jgi:DNA-directed RNA polymerase subunit RPC12/RpoP